MLRHRVDIGKSAMEVVEGDLTRLEVDVVVNAANEQLQHGGGVAAAIVRAGGATIQTESNEWVQEHGPLARGGAATTSAGALPSTWVIHVVGPRYGPDQDNAGMLEEAVQAALDAADGVDANSVAMPAISAGIFGYPRSEATRVIAETVATWLSVTTRPMTVKLVGYDAAAADDFVAAVTAIDPL